MRNTGQRYVRSFSPSLSLPVSPFVPFSWYIGRPPKYNAVLGFGALTPTSPPSSHPDSPESEKTETTFTFPAPVQPVSLPSPTSTDVSNLGNCALFLRAHMGKPLSCVVSLPTCSFLPTPGTAVFPAGHGACHIRQLSSGVSGFPCP